MGKWHLLYHKVSPPWALLQQQEVILKSVNMACNECSQKKKKKKRNIWTDSKILKIPMEVFMFEEYFRPYIQEIVVYILFSSMSPHLESLSP